MPSTQGGHPAAALLARLLLPLLLVTLAAPVASAYDYEVQRGIAEAAYLRLDGEARRAVARIIGKTGVSSSDLGALASWPGDLNAARRRGDRRASLFNAYFPRNQFWHYADFPLGAEDYEQLGRFHREDDIVHIIERCVAILESPDPDPKFSKLNALRFLVSLTAQIHQPLHVATGYYEAGRAALVSDPARAAGLQNDLNGEALLYREGASYSSPASLHRLWDGPLVWSGAGVDRNSRSLARKIRATVSSPSWQQSYARGLDTPGDYHTWARAWAMQSVSEARRAYEGIVFVSVTPSALRARRARILLPSGYMQGQRTRALNQVVYASHHLASLLNSIGWQGLPQSPEPVGPPPVIVEPGPRVERSRGASGEPISLEEFDRLPVERQAELLNADGPLLPAAYEVEDLSMRVFVRGGWPVVVNYSLEAGASASLTLEAEGVAPTVQSLSPGAGRQVVFVVPPQYGASPRVSKLSIRVSGGRGVEPLRLHALGMGEAVVRRRAGGQVRPASYLPALVAAARFGAAPPFEPAPPDDIPISGVRLDPTEIEAARCRDVLLSFSSAERFAVAAAEFYRVEYSRTARRLVHTFAFAQRFRPVPAEETIRGNLRGCLTPGGVISFGQHELKLRVWRRASGPWLVQPNSAELRIG